MKVLGMVETMLNVDDKADKNDYENDTEEEDIVDDENYKEKDEDDEDDVDNDDDKVVKLASKNEEHYYQEDDYGMVLISSNEDKYCEKLPKNQTQWLHQYINWKSFSKLNGCNQICELQYKCHSNLA